MFAYCNNNPVMYVDPTGEFGLISFLVFCTVVAVVGLTATSCGPADNDLTGTPADPAPKTTPYDTPEEAINAGIDYVWNKTEEVNWGREVVVSVIQYENGKYYIEMDKDGVGDYRVSYPPTKIRNATVIATIHSHTEYQQEPFKQDWNFYFRYNKQMEMYIVDNYYGTPVVRYLPVGATDNVHSVREYPWK